MKHDDQKLTKGAEADEFRRLEPEWQNQIGKDLLDVPWQQEGAREVFERQFERIAECLDLNSAGLMVEIGCGKGHLLEFLQGRRSPDGPMLVGIDVSEAAVGAREKGLLALRADGEFLPLPDESVSAFVYDGALHHLIDFEAGLRDAYRALKPGGSFVLFEPVSSPFSRLVHRILDPIVFKKVEYESPIDQHYKDFFRGAARFRDPSRHWYAIHALPNGFPRLPIDRLLCRIGLWAIAPAHENAARDRERRPSDSRIPPVGRSRQLAFPDRGNEAGLLSSVPSPPCWPVVTPERRELL